MANVSGALWDGVEPRTCGEHRTVGYRAWCYDCGEWCYPDAHCLGCDNATPEGLERQIEELQQRLAAMRDDG